MNKLQERALWIINGDQKKNFQDLISKYKEYNIQQNIKEICRPFW